MTKQMIQQSQMDGGPENDVLNTRSPLIPFLPMPQQNNEDATNTPTFHHLADQPLTGSTIATAPAYRRKLPCRPKPSAYETGECETATPAC